PWRCWCAIVVVRSIPTCVGLTVVSSVLPACVPVHPHVRGAHAEKPCRCAARCGPSPRAWGSRRHPQPQVVPGRSIPTCVGLTTPTSRTPPRPPVHPHVRGAHITVVDRRRARGGPSPRAWGSLAQRPDHVGPGRSIPTCVGLTQRKPSDVC